MTSNRTGIFADFLAATLCVCSLGCGGGSSLLSSSPPQPISVLLAPQTATVVAADTARLTATVANDGSGKGVTWTLSCSFPQCGTISALGQTSATYTAPSSVPAGAWPTPITITGTSVADSSKSASASIIPVGHIAGYDVGVDYHAFGDGLDDSAFINEYNQPQVRQTVQAQLQAMADRGATLMHTRVWMVNNPGDNSFMGLSYREFFPLSDQEAANLRAYAQDVAAVQGASGNRMRLDICLLWLGAADYTIGSPITGLGYFQNITASDYISRVATTTDKVLAAVSDIVRPDGVHVVDTIYLDGTEAVDNVPNQQWFLTTNYPRFFSVVAASGIRPSVYFNGDGSQADVLDDSWIDPQYPILNGHRSMFEIYRSINFMVQQGLPIPSRIDIGLYLTSTGATYDQLLQRVLDDADATLPSLGAPKLYGIAETSYLTDPTQRLQYGQAFATQAAYNSRLQWVAFWSTPPGFPFTIEDYMPPAPTS